MTTQESKVKSFVMLGNIPFTDNDLLVNVGPVGRPGNTQFIMNIRVKYEIGRVELIFNQQTQAFQYIQGSTPGVIDLDIGSLNLLIHLIKFGTNSVETNLTFTSGPNGLASQIWGSYTKVDSNSIFKIGENTYTIIGSIQESLLLTQLEIALKMLIKGTIEYSVKKDHIAGRMQSGSNIPAPGTPGSTPPAPPGAPGAPAGMVPENNMNTAPESVTIQRPNFGPDLNKAPGNPIEIIPTIPVMPNKPSNI